MTDTHMLFIQNDTESDLSAADENFVGKEMKTLYGILEHLSESCISNLHVFAAASAAKMFQLLRCVPRVLGTAIAGLRAAAPSLPLLQPASRDRKSVV